MPAHVQPHPCIPVKLQLAQTAINVAISCASKNVLININDGRSRKKKLCERVININA